MTTTSSTTTSSYAWLENGTVDNPILWAGVAAAVLLFIAFVIIMFCWCRPRPPRPPLAIHNSDLAPHPRATVWNAEDYYNNNNAYYYDDNYNNNPAYYDDPASPRQQRPPHRDYYPPDDQQRSPVVDNRGRRFYDRDIPQRSAADDLRQMPNRIYDQYFRRDRN